MLNKELEFTLNLAFKEAKEKRHEFMTVEHLLLSLLDNPAASNVLQACEANADSLRQDLIEFIEETTPLIPRDELGRETQPTLGFQRVLQRAVFHVQSAGKTEVSGANVLAAIFSEQESQAVYFLRRENITRLDVINYISHGVSKYQNNEMRDSMNQSLEEDMLLSDGSESPLESYCMNLNKRAKLGKIDPLIGRNEEIQRTVQILCRRRKNNPLLVGEAGVGKTAILTCSCERSSKSQVKIAETMTEAEFFIQVLGVCNITHGQRSKLLNPGPTTNNSPVLSSRNASIIEIVP